MHRQGHPIALAKGDQQQMGRCEQVGGGAHLPVGDVVVLQQFDKISFACNQGLGGAELFHGIGHHQRSRISIGPIEGCIP